MAANLVVTIQHNLDYPPLSKIDPNLQEPKSSAQSTMEATVQAAIPAVLAGLYRQSRSVEGTQLIINNSNSKNWLKIFFGDHEQEAVSKVAGFAGVSEGYAATHMEMIADEAVFIIREAIGPTANVEKWKTYMNDQRHNILVYLPAVLQFGYLLNDGALDDRTNKMEGPMSNMVHKIEDLLSGGDA
jgi:hypothetical protein